MLDYGRLVGKYSARNGELAWPLLYHADVRCRLEHVERLRRVPEGDHEIVAARGQAPATHVDPAPPGDSAWSAAVADQTFWAKSVPGATSLDSRRCHYKRGTNRALLQRLPRRRRGRGTNRTSRSHTKFIWNRTGSILINSRGSQLCQDWQVGT